MTATLSQIRETTRTASTIRCALLNAKAQMSASTYLGLLEEVNNFCNAEHMDAMSRARANPVSDIGSDSSVPLTW